MKKAFYLSLTVLQAIFLIAAFGIQLFSMKKMGMMRYIVYISRQWEAQYPISAIRLMAIALVILLFIIIFICVLTKKDRYITGKKALLMLTAEAVSTFAFIFFALSYSTENYRSYYFTGLILAAIALIQDVKILVYLKRHD